jgi:hypothetical protein
MEGISTFDQALDQRRRAAASDFSMPKEIWDLGQMALRLSDRMRVELPAGAPPRAETRAPTTPPAGTEAKADDMISRAQQLIDRSFGFAVLTQQLVRGANQVASGLMTLLRSN